MPTPIEERYAQLLAGILNLGQPFNGEEQLYDGGSKQVYEFGRIYFHPRLAMPFECHGAILDAYLDRGAELSQLGYPTSDEMDNPHVLLGRMNTFEFGAIKWDPGSGITVEVDDTHPGWVERVVVKFLDSVPVSIPAGEEIDFGQLVGLFGPIASAIDAVAKLSAMLGDASVRRCFGSMSVQELDDLVTRALAKDPDYEPPNFDRFFEIEIPDGVDAAVIVHLLRLLSGIVEYAYVAGIPSNPNVIGTTNPLFGQQTYLAPAPTGIGAAAAWTKGADGAGVRLIDIEQGWFLGHDDLPKPIHLLEGVNEASSYFHGTAVLGVIVGIDDVRGIVGIAPECTVDVLSHSLPRGQKRRERLPEVIASAARSLNCGDVLLLEVENIVTINGTKQTLPVESERLESDTIRLATKAGVIVVEAAGNGSVDLDFFVDDDGKHTLNCGLPLEFRDSGAIMVGACTSSFPHSKLNRSNNGSRIDCNAFGERIATTGDPDHPDKRDAYVDPNRQYKPGIFGFGGTSGASAIIAGVCLLVQHLRSLLTPIGSSGRIGPAGMRALLRKPANGTDSFLVNDKIGVMPNLAAIIANEFQP